MRSDEDSQNKDRDTDNEGENCASKRGRKSLILLTS